MGQLIFGSMFIFVNTVDTVVVVGAVVNGIADVFGANVVVVVLTVVVVVDGVVVLVVVVALEAVVVLGVAGFMLPGGSCCGSAIVQRDGLASQFDILGLNHLLLGQR